MLTTIFSKTKPINYLLIAFGLIIAFTFHVFFTPVETVSGYFIFQKSSILILFLLSFFWTNFITQKNEISKSNNYALLVFLFITVLNPSVFIKINLVISSFFVILAFRRIVSLRTFKQTKQKIFDASLLILVASLFHFHAIFFLVLVFAAVFIYTSGTPKNLLIPFIAFISVGTIYFGLDSFQDFQLINSLKSQMQFEISSFAFKDTISHVVFSLYAAFSILVLIYGLISYPTKQLNTKGTYSLTFLYLVTGTLVYLLNPIRSNSVLIFTLVPVALLSANFIEEINKNGLKNAVLYTILLVSFFFFILQLNF